MKKSERKDNYIRVRVSDRELALVESAALVDQLKLATWARRTLLLGADLRKRKK